MITKLKIDGFKTFKDFEMEFAPLTVIAGTNASGKSNLFDALQLLSRVAEFDLRTAFSQQRGEAWELFTQYDDHSLSDSITFHVELMLNKRVKDNWGGTAELKYTRLKYELTINRQRNDQGWDDLIVAHEHLETLKHDDDIWVKNNIPASQLEFWRPKVPKGRRGTPYIETDARAIIIRQDDKGGNKKEFPLTAGITQSILSGVNSVDFKHAFAVKEELRTWRFLQLDPEALREPTKQDIGARDTISRSGENLAAALNRIKLADEYALKDISRKLNNLLPNLIEVNVHNDKANKQFIIKITSEDGRIFSSRVLSEGTLRLLALCIFQFDDQHNGLLCFEEPENGIHPARIKEMCRLLIDLSVQFNDPSIPLRQVIVNTHSPLIVNEVLNISQERAVVWLSQFITKTIEVGDRKLPMNVSKMIPIETDLILTNKGAFTINFPEEEKKLVVSQLIKYLESADFEKKITALKR